MRTALVLTTLCVTAAATLSSSSHPRRAPAAAGGPRNFIYFGLERARIHETSFLSNPGAVGAQLKYTWRELEPERDRYAFDSIRADLAFLEEHGKQLFIQLQDVSFEGRGPNVPDYVLSDPAFHGGVALQYYLEDDDPARPIPEGWLARRWDPAVRARFSRLLEELAASFDGRIAGLNLPETAIGFGRADLWPDGYTPDAYYRGIMELLDSAAAAFDRSPVVIYANFMPGEELPDEDRGYLKGVYARAESLGLGVGGPDLLPNRWFQRQHSLPLIAGRSAGTIAAVAVQWGNLEDRNRTTGERVTVDELYRFAKDELRLDFLFWGTQEPFYSRDILPYLRSVVGGEETVASMIRDPVFFAVQVRDVEVAAAWYADVFGMRLVKRLDAEDGRYAIRILSGGPLTVELLHETRAEEPPARSYGLFKAGLQVKDIDRFHERLVARGVDADDRVVADSALGVRTFVFRDAEGNRLQAFQKGWESNDQ